MIRIPRPVYLRQLWSSWKEAPGIDLGAAKKMLASYDVGRWKAIDSLSGGRNSHSLLIDTERGKQVLKKHRWPLSSIEAEHAILRHLEGTGFPTPKVMRNRDGETCIETEGEHFALYDFNPGFKLNDFYVSPSLRCRFIAQTGMVLGRFHQHMDGYVPQGWNKVGFTPDGERLWRDTDWTTTLDRVAARIRRECPGPLHSLVLENHEKIRRDLRELGRWHDEIHSLWPKLVIHGSCVVKHVKFGPRGLIGLVDLGGARLDMRVFDVGRSVTSFACRGSRGLDC